jgi:hypothetical protein
MLRQSTELGLVMAHADVYDAAYLLGRSRERALPRVQTRCCGAWLVREAREREFESSTAARAARHQPRLGERARCASST